MVEPVVSRRSFAQAFLTVEDTKQPSQTTTWALPNQQMDQVASQLPFLWKIPGPDGLIMFDHWTLWFSSVCLRMQLFVAFCSHHHWKSPRTEVEFFRCLRSLYEARVTWDRTGSMDLACAASPMGGRSKVSSQKPPEVNTNIMNHLVMIQGLTFLRKSVQLVCKSTLMITYVIWLHIWLHICQY